MKRKLLVLMLPFVATAVMMPACSDKGKPAKDSGDKEAAKPSPQKRATGRPARAGDSKTPTPPATRGAPTGPSAKTLTLDLGKGVTMKLVLIPAGKFRMGSGVSPEELARQYGEKVDTFADEYPQHEVRITKPFYLGATEVTQSQWKAVMRTEPWKGKPHANEGGENAATYTSWLDATAFCTALSKTAGRSVRLPTEAQWEYACRAGTTTKHSFGDDDSKLGDYAWYSENTLKVDEKYAHPVARKKPNAWGLYDMHGNVWEWCADWYDEKYYSASANGVDPAGPVSGKRRVLRGGSWISYVARLFRSADRGGYGPDNPGDRNIIIGFRVVVSLGSGVGSR